MGKSKEFLGVNRICAGEQPSYRTVVWEDEMARAFPRWLFVNQQIDSGDGSTYLNNYEEQAAAVDDDGPTKVATYQLVKVLTLAKRVEFVQPKTRRRKK